MSASNIDLGSLGYPSMKMELKLAGYTSDPENKELVDLNNLRSLEIIQMGMPKRWGRRPSLLTVQGQAMKNNLWHRKQKFYQVLCYNMKVRSRRIGRLRDELRFLEEDCATLKEMLQNQERRLKTFQESCFDEVPPSLKKKEDKKEETPVSPLVLDPEDEISLAVVNDPEWENQNSSCELAQSQMSGGE